MNNNALINIHNNDFIKSSGYHDKYHDNQLNNIINNHFNTSGTPERNCNKVAHRAM